MTLSDICIRRPVFATVLSLIIVLLGLLAYQRLAVREYPNIDVPIVTVNVMYPGASPEIMESQVAQPVEDVLSGIEGLDFVSSISRSENTQITAQFRLGTDSDEAANDVRDRLGRVRSLLPDEIDEPMVQKVEADAQPVIWLAFYSERFSAMEITDVIERVVQDRLQTIPGVSEVLIRGARTYAMRIWLDPEKLAAHDLTVQDVEDALRRQNVEIPAGRIESVQREFSVLAETDLQTPEEFNQLILDDSRGYLLRLADVGHAEIGAADERTLARFNGRSAVAVGMIKQATANPLDISDGLEQALPSLRKLLPEGMEMQVSNDNSQFIRESIDNVYTTIWEAVLLVILIIFLFLRSLRATLIPLVTIPVSLIGAARCMPLMGFSINTLTLLAMVLAIGLVVDDAIVVLENIHRHIEQGMRPLRAAFVGSREIAFPVIAMTLTLAAVYAPIGFMQGTDGETLHRIRLDPGRRRAGVRLRRPDPVADDVRLPAQGAFAAAAPQPPVQPHRAWPGGAEPELWAPAAAGAARLVAGAGGAGGDARPVRLAVPRPAQRAGADRGHRHHRRLDQRPGRRHPRLHQPLRQAAGGGLRLHPRGQPLHGHRRLPHGGPGPVVHEAGGLGRA